MQDEYDMIELIKFSTLKEHVITASNVEVCLENQKLTCKNKYIFN